MTCQEKSEAETSVRLCEFCNSPAMWRYTYVNCESQPSHICSHCVRGFERMPGKLERERWGKLTALAVGLIVGLIGCGGRIAQPPHSAPHCSVSVDEDLALLEVTTTTTCGETTVEATYDLLATSH